MGFEPVTRWQVRCDGDTTRGRCRRRLLFGEDDIVASNADGTGPADDAHPASAWWPALFDQPHIGADDQRWISGAGWLLLRDGRALCPAHVTSLEHLAQAALDGLPFPDTTHDEETR